MLYILQLLHWVKYRSVSAQFLEQKCYFIQCEPCSPWEKYFSHYSSEFETAIYSAQEPRKLDEDSSVLEVCSLPHFWCSSNPNPCTKLCTLEPHFSLFTAVAVEFTSSAACFELRSASSLCADGAWGMQATWYWNFLSICAQSAMERL